MKRAIAALAVTGALVGLFPTLASADAISRFTERVRSQIFNPCAGENVVIRGRHRVLFKFSTQEQSDRFLFVQHSRLNLTAVGLDSGTEYRAIERINFEGTGVITDSPQEIETGQAVLHFIAQGSTDDFHLHNKFHITITPSGEVTAVIMELGDVVCHG